MTPLIVGRDSEVEQFKQLLKKSFSSSLGFVLVLMASAGPTRAAEPQTVVTFQRTLTKTVEYRYLLSLPAGFHGAKDPTVPLSESETMAAELKKAGVTDVHLTIYPEARHDSWTETYNNPELYAWLLKHRR